MDRELKHKIFTDGIKARSLRNIQIEKATGYSDSQVSSYKTNRVSIPETFIYTFAEKFNIDLKQCTDFTEPPANNEVNDYPTTYEKMTDSERLEYFSSIKQIIAVKAVQLRLWVL